MTVEQQQIDFCTRLRKSEPLLELIAYGLQIPVDNVAELIRDINENVVAVRNWKLGQPVHLCDDCNKPLEGFKIQTAELDGKVIFIDKNLCHTCATNRIDNAGEIPVPKSVLELPKSYFCPECGFEVSADGFDHSVPVTCTRAQHDLPVAMEPFYN